MEQNQKGSKDLILEEKIERLIAIGAAAASNCIPCFEHLYESAITSGLTAEQIKRASDTWKIGGCTRTENRCQCNER